MSLVLDGFYGDMLGGWNFRISVSSFNSNCGNWLP